MIGPETIVYCFGCSRRVRYKVIREIPTGEDEDLERWCLDCLSDIDEATKFMLSDKPVRPPDLEEQIQRFLDDKPEKGT